jgi:hypothetical protein
MSRELRSCNLLFLTFCFVVVEVVELAAIVVEVEVELTGVMEEV